LPNSSLLKSHLLILPRLQQKLAQCLIEGLTKDSSSQYYQIQMASLLSRLKVVVPLETVNKLMEISKREKEKRRWCRGNTCQLEWCCYS
jgi:hypothetical protein